MSIGAPLLVTGKPAMTGQPGKGAFTTYSRLSKQLAQVMKDALIEPWRTEKI